MSKNHEVNIVIAGSDGDRESVVKTRKHHMREWLIRRLFGDATNLNEIGDADYAYEIKSGSSQEEICGIISSICIDLKREDDLVNARYENGEYIIISNGITIGRAVINDKATTDLLKIYFCK